MLIDVISVLVPVLSADLKGGIVLYVIVPFVCYLFSVTLVLWLFCNRCKRILKSRLYEGFQEIDDITQE